MSHDMKRTLIVLVILGLAVFVIIANRNFRSIAPSFNSSGKDAEKSHAELLNEYRQGHNLTSRDINVLTAYYISSLKYDEGITVLEKIANKQDGYMTYYSLCALYGNKAKIKKHERDNELIKRAHYYLLKGFTSA